MSKFTAQVDGLMDTPPNSEVARTEGSGNTPQVETRKGTPTVGGRVSDAAVPVPVVSTGLVNVESAGACAGKKEEEEGAMQSAGEGEGEEERKSTPMFSFGPLGFCNAILVPDPDRKIGSIKLAQKWEKALHRRRRHCTSKEEADKEEPLVLHAPLGNINLLTMMLAFFKLHRNLKLILTAGTPPSELKAEGKREEKEKKQGKKKGKKTAAPKSWKPADIAKAYPKLGKEVRGWKLRHKICNQISTSKDDRLLLTLHKVHIDMAKALIRNPIDAKNHVHTCRIAGYIDKVTNALDRVVKRLGENPHAPLTYNKRLIERSPFSAAQMLMSSALDWMNLFAHLGVMERVPERTRRIAFQLFLTVRKLPSAVVIGSFFESIYAEADPSVIAAKFLLDARAEGINFPDFMAAKGLQGIMFTLISAAKRCKELQADGKPNKHYTKCLAAHNKNMAKLRDATDTKNPDWFALRQILNSLFGSTDDLFDLGSMFCTRPMAMGEAKDEDEEILITGPVCGINSDKKNKSLGLSFPYLFIKISAEDKARLARHLARKLGGDTRLAGTLFRFIDSTINCHITLKDAEARGVKIGQVLTVKLNPALVLTSSGKTGINLLNALQRYLFTIALFGKIVGGPQKVIDRFADQGIHVAIGHVDAGDQMYELSDRLMEELPKEDQIKLRMVLPPRSTLIERPESVADDDDSDDDDTAGDDTAAGNDTAGDDTAAGGDTTGDDAAGGDAAGDGDE